MKGVEDGYDKWLLANEVYEGQEKEEALWEQDVGDSCCWGVRTVDIGMDCVWKIHGGV